METISGNMMADGRRSGKAECRQGKFPDTPAEMKARMTAEAGFATGVYRETETSEGAFPLTRPKRVETNPVGATSGT